MGKASWLVSILILSVLSCRNDAKENPRAYVEGKVVSLTVDYQKFRLRLISKDIETAETQLSNAGAFQLSGPISGDGFAIMASEKIRSFSTDKSGLQLSADSLQINVPKGVTYLKFHEIVLAR